jgi:hypothetical protein
MKRLAGFYCLTSGWLLAGAAAAADVSTYTKDIAPILWNNCAGCHRPGEIGPFSLLTLIPIDSDKAVALVDFRPSNRKVVHHALMYRFQEALGRYDTNHDGKLTTAEIDAMPENRRDRVRAAIEERLGDGED